LATELISQEITAAPDRPLRVLIVRIGAMGDVLHAMPAVAALRERHPEWSIGWAIEPRWSELLQIQPEIHDPEWKFSRRDERRPLVDKWTPVPTREWQTRPLAPSTLMDIRALRRDLRADQYDICVDMQGLVKSAVVGWMAHAKEFVGSAQPREAQAAWLYGRRVKVTATHVIERGCELLGSAIGEVLRPAKVTLPVDAAAERWCDELLSKVLPRGEPFAFMAPTAGWGAKQWPAERFGAVAAELAKAGLRTLVNDPPGGHSMDRVVEASGGAATLVPCTLGQMIALMRRAGVMIAGDTGPLHLAAALERPVVALFGPTDPARTGPYGLPEDKVRVLRHEASKTDHGRNTDTEDGLMQITVDEVVEAALSVLQAERNR
jgi:heptosyltransferase I